MKNMKGRSFLILLIFMPFIVENFLAQADG
jgi:hypothetical protein